MDKKIITKVAKKLTKQPKTLAELSASTGYDTSTVKNVIQFLRLEGCAVCSGAQGYWLWNGRDDSWNKTMRKFEKMSKTTTLVYNAMLCPEHYTIKEVLAEL